MIGTEWNARQLRYWSQFPLLSRYLSIILWIREVLRFVLWIREVLKSPHENESANGYVLGRKPRIFWRIFAYGSLHVVCLISELKGLTYFFTSRAELCSWPVQKRWQVCLVELFKMDLSMYPGLEWKNMWHCRYRYSPHLVDWDLWMLDNHYRLSFLHEW